MSLPHREEMSTRILVALIADLNGKTPHSFTAEQILRNLAKCAALATEALIEENAKYD